jgi:hypothetical protein
LFSHSGSMTKKEAYAIATDPSAAGQFGPLLLADLEP